MSKLVAESLDESMNEGKFGKGLAMAGLAGAMAFSPMQKAAGQNTTTDSNQTNTEISSETEQLTPILRKVESVSKDKDGNYIIKVEAKSRSQSTLRRIGQMTANSEALHQENPGQQNVQGTIQGSKIIDTETYVENGVYTSTVTVKIPAHNFN